MLPSTRHKWTHTTLNHSQSGRYSVYLPKRDGRLSWPRWPVTYTEIIYPPTDGHPSKYYPSSARPGVELAACWSRVRRPNHSPRSPSRPKCSVWISIPRYALAYSAVKSDPYHAATAKNNDTRPKLRPKPRWSWIRDYLTALRNAHAYVR